MTQRHRRDRKKKRLLYGGAAAVVATATLGTLAVASPGLLAADGAKAAGSGLPLQTQFADAAREFDVPQSVLMAVSYQQTRWESHDGEPSTTGAYNVMGLTKVDPGDVARKVTDEQIDHFNGSGRPEIEKKFDRAMVRRILEKAVVDTDDPRLHTLDKGAELIGSSTETVENDTAASIRAGAALLAEYQKQAGAELSEDPGDWYPAVARYSQSPERKGADLFARRVFASIKEGERALTLDGEQVALPAAPSVEPVKPSNVPLAATPAAVTADPVTECPATLNCNFVPVRTDPGGAKNYTPADRPDQGVDIRQIVIHDTEGGYQGSLDTLTDPKGAGSAHYLIRAQDGQVTQMLENKQLAWHAGNWTHNMHSIGVEHEGFAMKEGSWFTEPQYRSSAELVKFLAKKYDVPVDREHIIGHDEVALQTDGRVSSLHWDAGPYWDWNYYMSLLGAPQGDKGAGAPLQAGQVVRVVPPFTPDNQPKLTTGGTTATARPANFGYLYTTPSTSGTPLKDPYFTSSWSEGSNYGNKVRAGGSYVVAESRTDWTAIWYAGEKAWFFNPGNQYTVPVRGATTVTVKAGATSAKVFGRAFPETAAYTAAGLTAPGDENASLTKFSLPAGQSYVKAGPAVKGDDWFGSAQRNVVGQTLFVPIRFHHKITWVKQSDVVEAPGVGPVASDNRYNLLARDASGALWQHQGTGSATTPFLSRYRVGGGWQVYDTITPMTALRADGTGDAVARDASGVLWYYQGSGNPSAPFKGRLRVGGGWQIYDLIIGVRDLTGDGKADLIGREKSGYIWLYAGTGDPARPFAARVRIGNGWQVYNNIISTGDLTSDGKPDLIGRDATGTLWLYKGSGNAASPYAARVQVGNGWQVYNSIVGPSDLTGDGKVDFVGRDASGALWLYKGTGNAASPYAGRVQVGTDWQSYNLIF
ncbi:MULTISPECIES: N-acetylmuramoyl-L-alanine amidase [unclassified Streptomyces]|uniref:N-acetylmuramoyl-L-alanine amidase n=1 Tax=unclassified Streptomyces TaxID=2593676 RepID=UPI0016606360|nr:MULTISPECIES: N-acetylmuramoyl-L-alanine amidase [unclassified Streptomyces]MBD0708470.1 N-acetylmuramoyl-L-alanine amidase [Streptomyces sp. CBMA291]MBD0717210.1 N-acetylmuramoyl-L-alanine amidase [Streptomyces sp. CBMA370]